MIDNKIYEDDIIFDLIDQLSECPSKKSNNFFIIPEEDMRQFIANVRAQKVTFESHAEIMLKNYYTATKTIRKSKKKNYL